ncbi:PREDICTED: uncharacterized protein LOC105114127 [Populus euphratica]|uniref:Uncharacterized protein LOC105114127 n=1 Tax=Populus euphratica TaxID=75702 RepID=A0AAJ6TCK8_POPEU|nr:PREDICTED: uncharacterized protein LOC105114127 [Populus euphratica]
MVEMIINVHPHAIENLNKEGQSILDMAVMYRQKKIFDFLKQQKIPLARMRGVVDSKGNTLLHHVAEKGKNSGVTKPGPALQLQEELQWFEQVRKVIPSNYVPLLKNDGRTARAHGATERSTKMDQGNISVLFNYSCTCCYCCLCCCLYCARSKLFDFVCVVSLFVDLSD